MEHRAARRGLACTPTPPPPGPPASPSRRLPASPPLPLPCGKRVFCTVFFTDTRHARAWRSSATQLLSRPMAPGHAQTPSRRRHSALAPTSARRAHRAQPPRYLATLLPSHRATAAIRCRGRVSRASCVGLGFRAAPMPPGVASARVETCYAGAAHPNKGIDAQCARRRD